MVSFTMNRTLTAFFLHPHAGSKGIINNMGFRDDKDYSHEKEKGKLRVVFVGDSFTVGHGIKNISKRFSGIIEARLKEEMPDTNYEVYTLAQNGWDTVHEVDSLNRLMDVGFEADLPKRYGINS